MISFPCINITLTIRAVGRRSGFHRPLRQMLPETFTSTTYRFIHLYITNFIQISFLNVQNSETFLTCQMPPTRVYFTWKKKECIFSGLSPPFSKRATMNSHNVFNTNTGLSMYIYTRHTHNCDFYCIKKKSTKLYTAFLSMTFS